jgi:hypothetical protein
MAAGHALFVVGVNIDVYAFLQAHDFDVILWIADTHFGCWAGRDGGSG